MCTAAHRARHAAVVPTVKSLVGIADTAQTVTLTVAKAGTVVVTVRPNAEYDQMTMCIVRSCYKTRSAIAPEL